MKQAFYAGMPYTDLALAAMLLVGVVFAFVLFRTPHARTLDSHLERLPLEDDRS